LRQKKHLTSKFDPHIPESGPTAFPSDCLRLCDILTQSLNQVSVWSVPRAMCALCLELENFLLWREELFLLHSSSMKFLSSIYSTSTSSTAGKPHRLAQCATLKTTLCGQKQRIPECHSAVLSFALMSPEYCWQAGFWLPPANRGV